MVFGTLCMRKLSMRILESVEKSSATCRRAFYHSPSWMVGGLLTDAILSEHGYCQLVSCATLTAWCVQ